MSSLAIRIVHGCASRSFSQSLVDRHEARHVNIPWQEGEALTSGGHAYLKSSTVDEVELLHLVGAEPGGWDKGKCRSRDRDRLGRE